MKKLAFLLLGLLGIGMAHAQIPISPTLFGQNAWYINVNDTNASTFSSGFDAQLTAVAQSGVQYVRIGGIGPNYNPLYSWNGSYSVSSAGRIQRLKHLIDAIRAKNMEPVIQVGYNPLTPLPCSTGYGPLAGISRANQALIAGSLVKLLNDPSTGLYKTKPILYWSIANEPDLGINSCSNPWGFAWDGSSGMVSTHAANIAGYIIDFSTQMKQADPNIKVMGPELAAFGNDSNYYENKLMNQLVSNGPNSIMGQISCVCGANGKYYVDVISFHHYPNSSNITSRADIMNEPGITVANGFANDLTTTTNLKQGIVDMILASTTRSISNISVACTELNIDYHDGYDEKHNYSGMLGGLSNRSFLAGQWMADTYAQAMNAKTPTSGGNSWVSMVNLWSVEEGDSLYSLSYISPYGSNRKRSEYWHYWMLARHFKGNFYMGNSTLSNFKVFTAANCDQIAVMLLNEDSNAQTANVTFNTSYGASNTRLNQGATATFTRTLNGEESRLLLFDPCAHLMKEYYYNKSRNLSDLSPDSISYTGNFCTCNGGGGGGGNGRVAGVPAKDSKGVAVVSQPNPHGGQGFVYVQLGDAAYGELTITDAFGKVMDHVTVTPDRDVISIDYKGYPNGVYILNLTTDKGESVTNKMLILR